MCANVCVANEREDFSIFNETFDNLPFTIRTDEELSIRRENEDATMTNVNEENLSRWNSLTAVIDRYSLFLGNAVENDEEKLRSEFDMTVDQLPLSRRQRLRPPPDCYNHSNSNRRHNNICSSKQTNRTKDQANIRSTSLPAIRPNLISDHHLLSVRHRRYASEIVQQNVNRSVNFFSSPSMSSSSTTTLITSNDNEEDKTDSSLFDQIEISKIINRLIQRVESLENSTKTDDNLIDYLSYLFKKFTCDDDRQQTKTMFDTSHFVHHVCQTFVRHLSSSDSSNTNDQQSSETFVREYHSESNSTLTPTNCKTDQKDIWLVVDFQSKDKIDLTNGTESTMQNNETHCLLVPTSSSSSSTADEPFLLANENYFSLEEIKSCGSESSQSNYYSPNSSLVDLQNMVQDFDEMSNNINNNNNNNNTTLFNEDRSSTTDHFASNVISEVETNPVCSRLTNQSDDQQLLEKSSLHTEHPSITKSPSPSDDRMSRRERKLQERWTISTKSDQEQEHGTNKNLLGVEFPPIAVLRRKFSATSAQPSGNNILPSWKKDSTKTLNQKNESLSKGKEHQEIAPTTPSITSSNVTNDEIKHEQVIQASLNDVLSTLDSLDETSSIPSIEDKTYQGETVVKIDQEKSPMEITTNTVKQCEVDQSVTPMMIRTTVTPSSSSECLSTTTNDRPEEEKEKTTATTTTSTTATATTVDSFSSAIASLQEKEKEKEEEYGGDDNIVKAEEKDNCNVEVPQQDSESILTNVESMASIEGKDEEEEEEEQTEQQHHQQQQQQQQPDQNESSVSAEHIDENNPKIMNDENSNEYQRVEIEEIPDDEETLDEQRKTDIEPIDFIRTDDDLSTVHANVPLQSDPVVSCYEKTFVKVTDVAPLSNQRPEDDPIALRALQRFEQRLNASKTENQPISQKGKSSWSGSTSLAPRKSLDNLFKTKSPCESESFIRPRRAVFDDTNLHCVLTTTNHYDEEQPKAIDENNVKTPTLAEPTTNSIELVEDQHRPETMTIDTSTTVNNPVDNEVEPSNSLSMPYEETSLNPTMSMSSSESPSLAPYRLQLEGRRRLNTLERFRERRQNLDMHQYTPPPPIVPTSATTTDYSMKNEDVQDPIIRRALERFDEKNRALSQSRPTNYDDIQDPITRRALMRLESNLKRTMPMANNELTHEHSYTNNYTLGSLQPPCDQRYARPIGDASLPPPVPNHKPSHVSTHPRFCSNLSNHSVDLHSSGQFLVNGSDEQIPIMRIPMNGVQSIYPVSDLSMPSSNPINNVRQRSRSEDFVSSKELSLPQTQSNEIEPEISSDEPLASVDALTEDPVNQSDSSASTVLINNVQSEGDVTVEESHVQPLIDPTSMRNSHLPNDLSSSAFMPVHPSMNTYYSQQNLPTNNNYTTMYTSNNANQIPYTDDPIVRRALERFNCQMQQSMMSISQHSQIPPMPRPSFQNGYGRSGQLESFYAPDSNTPETWTNAYHSMPRPSQHSVGTNSCGYQSIIGRRRQMRQDEMFFDNTSVGNGYSSSLFLNNSNNPAALTASHYVNMSDDQPPIIPPRYSRDNYYHSQDYLSENMNNNNNSNQSAYLNNPNLYPSINNGFRPINNTYPPPDAFQNYPDDEYLRHRAQSTSSTTSSDSVNPIRLIHQRLPPTMTRTNLPPKRSFVHEQCEMDTVPSSNPSYGNNPSGDSVFHRLAYTGTKSSLSKSSSNLCANLTNKTSLPTSSTTTSNNLKPHEIDFDESNSNGNSPNEAHQEPILNSSKCQRSRSVDGRARLKNAQTRPPAPPHVSSRSHHDYEENSSSSSSKFTSVIQRRESQPPRLPVTPRSMTTTAAANMKRSPAGQTMNSSRPTPTIRTRTSQLNSTSSEHDQPSAQETESDEISSHADPYQPKIVDSRTRTSHLIQRHPTSVNGNHLQPSPSTSSVTSTMSRNKVLLPSSLTQLEGKETNFSTNELNRTSKRNDESRILSPNAQRRPVPVSVFAPAKPEMKRPAPAPPKIQPSTDESSSSVPIEDHSCKSEQINGTTDENPSTISGNDDEINVKSLTSMSNHLKSSTGNLLKEFSLANDSTNLNKKMNVFERLFRGHKKKI